jgi:hypothetical protein
MREGAQSARARLGFSKQYAVSNMLTLFTIYFQRNVVSMSEPHGTEIE